MTESSLAINQGSILRAEWFVAKCRQAILHAEFFVANLREPNLDPRKTPPTIRTRQPRPGEDHSEHSDKATSTRGRPLRQFGQGNLDLGKTTPTIRTRQPRPEVGPSEHLDKPSVTKYWHPEMKLQGASNYFCLLKIS